MSIRIAALLVLALAAPAAGADWKKALRKDGLSPKAIARLEEQKILVTNETWKQVFSPYLALGPWGRGPDGVRPVFITSDSLLAAWHKLTEESLIRIEQANVGRLGTVLSGMWSRLPDEPEPRVARILLGTALRLLDLPTPGADAKTLGLIAIEVKRIRSGTMTVKSGWLGPPDPGFIALEYSRYRPRGFYDRHERLARYFRAVQWLQSIPLRVDRDRELAAALTIGRSVTPSDVAFFRQFRELLAPEDDWDARDARRHAAFPVEDTAALRRLIRAEAARSGAGALVNDQFALPPKDREVVAELGYRVLAAARLPDAVLFGRTTDLRLRERPFPNGLEVCAALGSLWAEARMANVLPDIRRSRPMFEGSGLYCEYLRCVAALLEPPDPKTPAFMRSEAWTIKSCQTCLSGWAQLRHTFSLQAKRNAMYGGGAKEPAGFVEPVPVFFERLSVLTIRSAERMRAAGAFEPDLLRIADIIRAGLEAGDDGSHFQPTYVPGLSSIARALGWLEGRRADPQEFAAASRKAKDLADRIERGAPISPEVRKRLVEWEGSLESRWESLAALAKAAAGLARRQIDGRPHTKTQEAWIRGYGKALARIMLYDGNSWLAPEDDAPRVVDVYRNPNLGRVLQVAVARPRTLYVLYPTEEGEVLCRGVVLPYYEFTQSTALTDAEWKARLDSEEREATPAWLAPILDPAGLGVPKVGRR